MTAAIGTLRGAEYSSGKADGRTEICKVLKSHMERSVTVNERE